MDDHRGSIEVPSDATMERHGNPTSSVGLEKGPDPLLDPWIKVQGGSPELGLKVKLWKRTRD